MHRRVLTSILSHQNRRARKRKLKVRVQKRLKKPHHLPHHRLVQSHRQKANRHLIGTLECLDLSTRLKEVVQEKEDP